MAVRRILLHLFAWAAILTKQVAWSWLPPHPNSTIQWEPVQAMRERLGLVFNYTPRHIHPETCRYLTVEECEFSDMAMRDQQQNHPPHPHSLGRRLQRTNPKTGNIKALVLMIRFTDHVNRDLIPKSEIDAFWQTRVPAWLNVNSQGRYSIDANVINWQTTDNTEIHYSFGVQGIVPEASKMAWPILDQLESRPNWDWSEYDSDNDGRIDSVVMIHSGYGAETTETDCFGRAYTDRIWAHGFTGSSDPWVSKDGSMRLGGYTVASAFTESCGTVPAKIGLTVHEYMHTLGLEDLYDGVDPLANHGVGAFDIMSYPYGQGDDEDNPGHLSPWSKQLATWLEPTEITSDGVYTLKAAEISDEAYRITINAFGPYPEYLLIENRQPLEFDIDIWSSGLVIYNVDDAADLQMNVGYPGQPGWPENGNHYQVAVLQKDGNYDLEKGENQGDAGDIWEPGDILGPGMQGTVYPNTDSYQAGFVFETGITITVLAQTGTDVMFRVNGLGGETLMTEPPTIAPSEVPSFVPTTAEADSPSMLPSSATTETPSLLPSVLPTEMQNIVSDAPSLAPTGTSSDVPSSVPSMRPSSATTGSGIPSLLPSALPTEMTTSVSDTPSLTPTGTLSDSPSSGPSSSPFSAASRSPSFTPTSSLSTEPSSPPSMFPTPVSSSSPSGALSLIPSARPSLSSSDLPSESPTRQPSIFPSIPPTTRLTAPPTAVPTKAASESPSSKPSLFPTFNPPTLFPSFYPSNQPTENPSRGPTQAPTDTPSKSPTGAPSKSPTTAPTEPFLKAFENYQIPTLGPTPRPYLPSVPRPPAYLPTLDGLVIPTMDPQQTTAQPTSIVPISQPPAYLPTFDGFVLPTSDPIPPTSTGVRATLDSLNSQSTTGGKPGSTQEAAESLDLTTRNADSSNASPEKENASQESIDQNSSPRVWVADDLQQQTGTEEDWQTWKKWMIGSTALAATTAAFFATCAFAVYYRRYRNPERLG